MKITLKTVFIFLFLSLLIMRPTSSYAHWHEHTYVGVSLNTWSGPYWYDPYYYGPPYYYPYDYPYYYPYSPYYYPEPVVVSASSYQPVVVNGATYYVNNGMYYTYTPYGYQAVATPVTVPVIQTVPPTTVPVSTEGETFTVNVPNNKGGYTAVFLKKSGNGYIGPQGEFYSEFPTVSQLQKMYGK